MAIIFLSMRICRVRWSSWSSMTRELLCAAACEHRACNCGRVTLAACSRPTSVLCLLIAGVAISKYGAGGLQSPQLWGWEQVRRGGEHCQPAALAPPVWKAGQQAMSIPPAAANRALLQWHGRYQACCADSSPRFERHAPVM